MNPPTPQRDEAEALEKTVATLFEEIAAINPGSIALVSATEQLTYAELNRRANRVAHRLLTLGVTTESLVGVCLDRSPELIVAFLAILKAGAAFVPFDPAYPRDRLDYMLADTAVRAMITQTSLAHIAWPNRTENLILLDQDDAQTQPNEDANPPRTTTPESLAYVMYTSGSTGRPKGVLIENRGIVRLVFGQNYCEFGPDEIFLQAAPCSFDASTFEIWGALLHGAKLVIPPAGVLSLAGLAETIREHRVTTLWLTSGLFNVFVDEHLEDLRSVRQLLAGGDVLSARHIRRVLDTLPATTVINGYGPTENTTFTCCHVMRHGDPVPDPVPIGKPIAHTSVYLLDSAGNPVAQGETGELYAGGSGVARGYLNAPEATAQAFLHDPFGVSPDQRMYRTGDMASLRPDGTIDFLGRVDSQIKVNGYRIELGEIEAALMQYPQITQACVFVLTDRRDLKRIASCYVLRPGATVVERELKEFLKSKLPHYMVPAAFRSVPSIPLNPNGKVDRKLLASSWTH
jgi:amino acid adenylation domain-containing protein